MLDASGITEVPLTGDIAIESVELPGDIHSDPADRMLIATARWNGWTLATRDERILRHSVTIEPPAANLLVFIRTFR